ncbi:MAG: ammonia-forming cytochrome c nitrite reductase subunit c552 [Clostridium sp.]|nr:ammonia-forming cytochrome c nitrite reductase subunit c552 [Clostridium sp.]
MGKNMGKKILLTLLLILLLSSAAMAQSETCRQCHEAVVTPYLAGPHAQMDCARCHENSQPHAANPTTRPGVRVEAATCRECHQLQYESYFSEEGTDRTPQKQERFPLLRRLLAGHPFAEDYREPRSHINMLTSFVETARPRSATCMFCKSSDVYWQWNQNINYESNTGELLDQGVIRNPITCVQCHSPHVGGLRFVQPALREAIERMPAEHPGKDDPLQSRVCAQCHVNYNFNPQARGIEFPFVKVAQMPDYIQGMNVWRETKTGGWEHPEVGTMLYKVQHPETELYWGSVHHQLGVSCADCHMPKRTAANGQLYTNHWLTGPLNFPEEACGRCHQQTGEELTNRVRAIQDDVYGLKQTVMTTMDAALDNFAAAQDAANVNEELLEEARQSYFMAHLYWEWIASENSVGFHNPAEAIKALETANRFATEARDQAAQAAGVARPAPAPARRVPWIPLLLGLAVVGGAAAYFISRKK